MASFYLAPLKFKLRYASQRSLGHGHVTCLWGFSILVGCAPASRETSKVHFKIVGPQKNLQAKSSALTTADTPPATFELSSDSCYALHITGDKAPLNRVASPSNACANGPAGLGLIVGLYSKGDSAEIEVPVGTARRFDLIAIPKSALPSGNCSGTLTSDIGSDVQHPIIKVSDTDVSGYANFTLIAKGSADIVQGDNEIQLIAVSSSPAGVSYSCTLSPVTPSTNTQPVSSDQVVTLSEDTPKSITLNALDADPNDTLTFSIVTAPSHGTLSGTAPNIIYTPSANYTGSDFFTFTANDGKADSNTATVNLTITPVADVSVASNINPSAFNQDTNSPTITLAYTNGDGELATSCTTSNLNHVTVVQTCACDGAGVCTLAVRGTTSYSGTASFDYTVTTPNGGVSNAATANLTINDTAPPVVTIGSPSVSLVNSSGGVNFPISISGASNVTLVSGDVTITPTGGAGCSSKTVSGTGNTSRTVTLGGCTGDGTVQISIGSNAAVDASGNQSMASSPSSTVNVDNTAPTVTLGTPSASLVRNASATTTIGVTFSGATSYNLAATDVSFSGGPTCTKTISNGSTSTPTINLSSCTGNGSMTVSLAAGSAAQDAAGNFNLASSPSSTIVVDNTAPTVSITSIGTNGSIVVVDQSNEAAATVGGTCSENGQTVTLAITTSGGGGQTFSPVQTASCTANTFTTNVDMQGFPNGTLTVNASQPDPAGNVGNATAQNTTKSSALAVTAIYPTNGSHWGQYVSNNGSKFWNASDTSCSSTSGGYSTCLHGGELRKVIVPGQTNCANVSISDSLGAFNWICDATSGTVKFYTSGLKAGKHLSDLINFGTPAWANNSVTVNISSPSWSLNSPTSAWWSTTVNSWTGATSLSTGPAVYAANSNYSTPGITISANSISFVVAPTYRLNLNAAGSLINPNTTANYTWIEGVLNCNSQSSSYGINYGAGTHFNVVDGVKVMNCTSWGIGTNGGSNFYMHDVSVANSAGGIIFNYLNWSTINQARIYNSTNGSNPAVSVNDASNNVFSQVTLASNASDGINVHSTTATYGSNNRLVALTTAQNAGDGVWIDGANASGNVIHNLTTLNNSYGGLDLDHSTQTTAGQIAAINGGVQGVILNMSPTNKFTGNLVVGNNTSDCYVTASGNGDDGLIPTTCTNSGSDGSSAYTGQTSDATLRINKSLTTSFVGQATSDTTSPNDASGVETTTNLNANPVDWVSFDNPWRIWGKYYAAAMFTSNHRGYCATGNCQIWDWSLLAAANVIRNVTGNGSTANNSGAAFPSGAACPSEVSGNATLTSQTGGLTYLKSAIEVLNSKEGNGNGLCESNETCLYTPNFGAYQGHGAIQSCNFSNGTVTNVKMLGYATNGF